MVMAYIYALVDEKDKAIDELDNLLSIPSWSTVEYLKAEPIFASLRESPRFRALLEKYRADQRGI